MRWSVSVGAWTRWDTLLAAALAVGAGLAALSGPLTAPWLVTAGLVVATAGAAARLVVATGRARLEAGRERAEADRRLRVPVGLIGEIDPTMIGVDRAAQTVLVGGERPSYLPRTQDGVLRAGLEDALAGRGRWLIVAVGPSKVGKSRILGQDITLAVSGKLKAAGRPGPATLRLAARIGTVAAAAVPYVAATVILTIVFVFAAASGIEAARQSGIRHAQHIAARDAFAARVAFEVLGQPAQGELESLMAEWRRFLEPEVTATAGRCYAEAGRQIEALRSAGQLDAARAEWTSRYGQENGQPDVSFHGVRLRIFQALGGYDPEGPTDFTIDQLR